MGREGPCDSKAGMIPKDGIPILAYILDGLYFFPGFID